MDLTILGALIGAAGTIIAAAIGMAANRSKTRVIERQDKELTGLRQKAAPQPIVYIGDEMKLMSGSFQAGHKDPSGWQLLEGKGERPFEKRIDFPKPFKAPPAVVVSLTALDVSRKSNCRVKVEARAIDRNGFTVFFKTWSDTQVYSLSVQWLAYGD